MSDGILYHVSEACENLFSALSSVQEKSSKEEIILDHVKSCAAGSKVQIEDFKNNLEWFNVSRPLSLNKDLQGKVVVLDFFTYCCINCLHILPVLKQLEEEFSVQDGLIVVGVHSAKFDNEKDSDNIQAAIQRYNITHPVVNDADGTIWNQLSIPCWPTLLILGPSGEALFLVLGEGQKEDVVMFVKCALRYYRNIEALQPHNLPLSPSQHVASGPLLFPGKVACIGTPTDNEVISLNNNNSSSNERLMERLAVSDTGHHRIIVFSTSGRVEYVIGGDEPGFSDGCFRDARFNSPQGVVFRTACMLYVADTENHAVREINFKTLRVTTLFEQDGCSPWDLCLVSSSLMRGPQDMGRDVLLIVMAGVHQVWGLFLDTASWWKGKVYEAGICASIAGTGKEENRNNMYPHAAGFAQPSGLTAASGEQAVFIADSESSSIRKMSLVDGKVSAVVGGDRSPFNLFAFGDKDGKQFEARLQHPLGVAWCNQNQTLYVADSYNHKLKSVDIQRNFCSTLLGTGKPGSTTGTFEVAQLNEPGGLCVNTDGTRLYVADTNNHCVKVVELQEQQIEKLAIYLPSDHREPLSGKNKSGTVVPSEVKVNSSGGEINLSVSVMLADGIKLTAIAPQKWALEFPDVSWSASCAGGEYAQDMSLRVLVPRRKIATHTSFCVNYRLFICLDHTQCTMRNFHFQITVVYDDNAPALVQHQVSYEITP